MATEEQTQHNSAAGVDGTDEYRVGQQLTISNRVVSKLAFKLTTFGSPTGDVIFTIRETGTAVVIASKVWGDASSLPTSFPATAWQEVEFDAPILVNEEVWLFCEFAGGDGGNQVAFALQSDDVKADEYFYSVIFGDNFGKDATYIYTYTDRYTSYPATGSGALAGLTRASSIRHIFRPGFFRMQVALGDLGFDVDIAETAVRAELDTAKEVEDAIAEAVPSKPAVEEPEAYPYTPLEVMQPLYEAEAARRAAEAPTVREEKVVTPSAEAIRVMVEDSDKIAILQEIAKLSRSASAAGLTPYARDVLQKAIRRKQDELEAMYRGGE